MSPVVPVIERAPISIGDDTPRSGPGASKGFTNPSRYVVRE
jgi:hypothetical protein